MRKNYLYFLRYLAAALVLAAIWFWAVAPPPLAVATKRSDGFYIKVDLGDEAFEQVCLRYAHYGSVGAPDDVPCVHCPVSPKTESLIITDEDGPLRLAVWRGRYFDVYEIEFANDAAEDVYRYEMPEPSRCSKSPISIARCQPDADGKRCAFEFARFPEAARN